MTAGGAEPALVGEDGRKGADRFPVLPQRSQDELVVGAVSEQVGGERPAAVRGENQEDDEEAAADRDLVALEPQPHLLPVATRTNGVGLAELTVRFDRNGSRQPGGGGHELGFVLSCHRRKSEYTQPNAG